MCNQPIKVENKDTGAGIAGITVAARPNVGTIIRCTTNDWGKCTLSNLIDGDRYDLSVETIPEGYECEYVADCQQTITVCTTERWFYLNPVPTPPPKAWFDTQAYKSVYDKEHGINDLNATVYINNSEQPEKTPHIFEVVAPASYNIRIEKGEYHPWTNDYDVDKGETWEVAPILSPVTGPYPEITDCWWSTDAPGSNRITEAKPGQTIYSNIIIKNVGDTAGELTAASHVIQPPQHFNLNPNETKHISQDFIMISHDYKDVYTSCVYGTNICVEAEARIYVKEVSTKMANFSIFDDTKPYKVGDTLNWKVSLLTFDDFTIHDKTVKLQYFNSGDWQDIDIGEEDPSGWYYEGSFLVTFNLLGTHEFRAYFAGDEDYDECESEHITLDIEEGEDAGLTLKPTKKVIALNETFCPYVECNAGIDNVGIYVDGDTTPITEADSGINPNIGCTLPGDFRELSGSDLGGVGAHIIQAKTRDGTRYSKTHQMIVMEKEFLISVSVKDTKDNPIPDTYVDIDVHHKVPPMWAEKSCFDADVTVVVGRCVPEAGLPDDEGNNILTDNTGMAVIGLPALSVVNNKWGIRVGKKGYLNDEGKEDWTERTEFSTEGTYNVTVTLTRAISFIECLFPRFYTKKPFPRVDQNNPVPRVTCIADAITGGWEQEKPWWW